MNITGRAAVLAFSGDQRDAGQFGKLVHNRNNFVGCIYCLGYFMNSETDYDGHDVCSDEHTRFEDDRDLRNTQRRTPTSGVSHKNQVYMDEDVDHDPSIDGRNAVSSSGGRAFTEAHSSQPKNVFNISGGIQSGVTNVGGWMNIEQGVNVDMGDEINLSGSFQGSILNIKSQLDNVTQSIGSLPNADTATKEELTKLTTELAELLQRLPPEMAPEGEKVSKRVESLVNEASQPNPDKELVQFNMESLKKAAASIATALPTVLPIVTQIASHIGTLFR